MTVVCEKTLPALPGTQHPDDEHRCISVDGHDGACQCMHCDDLWLADKRGACMALRTPLIGSLCSMHRCFHAAHAGLGVHQCGCGYMWREFAEGEAPAEKPTPSEVENAGRVAPGAEPRGGDAQPAPEVTPSPLPYPDPHNDKPTRMVRVDDWQTAQELYAACRVMAKERAANDMRDLGTVAFDLAIERIAKLVGIT